MPEEDKNLNEIGLSTPTSNTHVFDFLDYYLDFGVPPQYAVLISGPWGVGKTFVLRRYLSERYAGSDNCIYVSLYGVSSANQIDEALFQALFPVMGLTTTKIATRVGTTALKYFGVDPDIKLSEFLTKVDGKCVVFDDLERSAMPVDEVMGYINKFVEHDGCKVIVLCNEEELPSNDQEKYRVRKEKLIGKTLAITSDTDGALTHFVAQTGDQSVKAFLSANLDQIKSLYLQAGDNNLRTLQQALWDFARLYDALGGEHRENELACKLLLQLLLAFSFEVKANRLNIEDMKDRRSAYVIFHMNRKTDEDDAKKPSFVAACDRYTGIDLDADILSDRDFINILFNGLVDEVAIRKSLDSSAFFRSASDEPCWKAVWRGLDLPEQEFNERVSQLEDQFEARKFVVVGEMLHVFGLRLWLADIGILSIGRAEVTKQCISYIDNLFELGKLEASQLDGRSDHDWSFGGHDGLGIRELKTPEMNEIFTHLASKRTQVTSEQYPMMASALLEEMKTEPELYFRRLCLTNSADNTYYRTPILMHIDPAKFVETILNLHPVNMRTAFSVFSSRYEHGDLEGRLSSEKPWLENVRDLLIENAKNSPPLAKFRTNKFLEWNLLQFVPIAVEDDAVGKI